MRRARISAAGSEGAHSKIFLRPGGVWYTSCKAVSTMVFVLPVPGGPEIRNGMVP